MGAFLSSVRQLGNQAQYREWGFTGVPGMELGHLCWEPGLAPDHNKARSHNPLCPDSLSTAPIYLTSCNEALQNDQNWVSPTLLPVCWARVVPLTWTFLIPSECCVLKLLGQADFLQGLSLALAH